MAPNYFRLNYNLGRTHSGMIAYLAEHWMQGNKAPLDILLRDLNCRPIPRGTVLRAVLEYDNVDLALLDVTNPELPKVLLLLEMKVDDFQGIKALSPGDKRYWKTLPKHIRTAYGAEGRETPHEFTQTTMYSFRNGLIKMRAGNRPSCIYLTLGTGEYHSNFADPAGLWMWKRLPDLIAALDKVDLPDDQLFQQWRLALHRELKLREQCFNVPDQREQEYDSGDRKGLLPMMRLGSLTRLLLSTEQSITEIGYTPTLYKHGPAPDTILNLIKPTDRRSGGFRFCEINNNGKLNFKIYFQKGDAEEKKRTQCQLFSESLNTVFRDQLETVASSKLGKSKTVARLDIGLEPHSLLPKKNWDKDSVAIRIRRCLVEAAPVLLNKTDNSEW